MPQNWKKSQISRKQSEAATETEGGKANIECITELDCGDSSHQGPLSEAFRST